MSLNERITVLVLQDPATSQQLRGLLEHEEYAVVETNSAEQALSLAASQTIELIILESELPGVNGIDLVHDLRSNASTRTIPVLMLSSKGDIKDKVAGFESGVDDYVTKPFLAPELVHRIRILLSHQAKRLRTEEVAPKRGMTIALFGTKGGVGRTTIGVNLAVALQRQSKGRVVVFDADFFFGDIALHLNVPPAHTIIDLVQRIDDLDADVLQQVLVPHSSGLSVLLSPRNPEDVESILPIHLTRLLDLMASCFDYVVVDCQAIYDERTLVLLDKADAILLVIKPEVGCVKNMAVFSEMAVKLGLSFDKKVLIALNRAGSKSGIGLKEIERIFRRQIAFQIPSAGNGVVVSVNRGIPLMIEHPNHPFSVQVSRMADYFVNGQATRNASR